MHAGARADSTSSGRHGRIILPVKPFYKAKRRLDQVLSPEDRAGLAEAMLRDVLTTLARSDLITRTVVATNDDVATRLAATAGAGVRPDHESSYNALLAGLARDLDREGVSFVVFLPADLPLLAPEDLATLLPALADSPAITLSPDRHGDGTNLLALSPPTLLVPSYGPGSFSRHLALAESTQAALRILEAPGLALDIDTPDDLAELVRVSETTTAGIACATRDWLDRAGLRLRESSVGRGVH
jgi:2-phospho-L-lactate guanylyltransferase